MGYAPWVQGPARQRIDEIESALHDVRPEDVADLVASILEYQMRDFDDEGLVLYTRARTPFRGMGLPSPSCSSAVGRAWVGREAWVGKRAELAKRLREGLGSLGLGPVAPAGFEANLVTAAWAADPAKIIGYLLANGIQISAGLEPLGGKVIRVGLMGRTASDEMVDRVLGLVAEAL